MTTYYLMKEIAPRDDYGSQYSICTFDGASRTFKVLFFAATEDEARGLHHRLLFGEDE